jgi:UDP-glucose 4-epimerase
MKVLVTGGAGYIGAVTVSQLHKIGHEVVVFDSLKHGDQKRIKDFPLVVGETTNFEQIRQAIRDYRVDAVIHFAAWIEMGESMKDPGKYFFNNVNGSLQLLNAMVAEHVDKLVFSSTAGVYGNPVNIPIKEDDPKNPLNPYGESKLMVETMLKYFDQIHSLRSISLRYFNAAGALPGGKLGECHKPESHLIPNIIKAVLNDEEFHLFGDDYKTKDGTCVRDYIHILDLASAHILSLDALGKGHKTDIYNVGTGNGYSNKEVLDTIEKISGKKVKLAIDPRRPGDADTLVADNSKIRNELKWKATHSDLKLIIQTAWDWHRKK